MPRALHDLPPINGALPAPDLQETLRPHVPGLIDRADRPTARVAQIVATHTRRAAPQRIVPALAASRPDRSHCSPGRSHRPRSPTA